MDPRWKAYLNKCEANGEKPKNRRFLIFTMENMKEFKEVNGIKRGRVLTDEEHQQFTEYLLEKYPTKEAM